MTFVSRMSGHSFCLNPITPEKGCPMPKSKKKKRPVPTPCNEVPTGQWTATLDFEGPPPSANVSLEDSLRNHIYSLEANLQQAHDTLREMAGTSSPKTKGGLMGEALMHCRRTADRLDVEERCRQSDLSLLATVTAYARQRNMSMQAVMLDLREELERRGENPIHINAVLRACSARVTHNVADL